MVAAKRIEAQAGPQTWFVTCPYPKIFFGGARGGAKSYSMALKWGAYAEMYGENAIGLIVRRTFKELTDFNENKLAKILLPDLGWNYAVGKQTWYHASGAKLILGYIDKVNDEDQYLGQEYTFIGIEEIGNFPRPEPLDKLDSSRRSPAGIPTFFCATGNPGGVGAWWVKKRWIDAQPNGMKAFPDPDTGEMTIYIPSLPTDNRILMENDPQYVNRLMKNPPHIRRAWILGDWTAAPAGDVFSYAWFQDVPEDEWPDIDQFEQIIQSWDTAFKKGAENDYSACITIGVLQGRYYILDVWRGKMEFPGLKKNFRRLAMRWCPNVIYVEDKASGQSLVQELRSEDEDKVKSEPGYRLLPPIKAINVDKDKLARANAIAPYVEDGRVLIPEHAPWRAGFLSELCAFPRGSHDDMVDAFTLALDRLEHRKNVLNVDVKVKFKKRRRGIRPMSLFQR